MFPQMVGYFLDGLHCYCIVAVLDHLYLLVFTAYPSLKVSNFLYLSQYKNVRYTQSIHVISACSLLFSLIADSNSMLLSKEYVLLQNTSVNYVWCICGKRGSLFFGIMICLTNIFSFSFPFFCRGKVGHPVWLLYAMASVCHILHNIV